MVPAAQVLAGPFYIYVHSCLSAMSYLSTNYLARPIHYAFIATPFYSVVTNQNNTCGERVVLLRQPVLLASREVKCNYISIC